jgi:hypothetical protein
MVRKTSSTISEQRTTKKSVDIPSSNEQFSLFMNRTRKNEEEQLAEIALHLKDFHVKADENAQMLLSLKRKLCLVNNVKLDKEGWLLSEHGESGSLKIYCVEIKRK